MGCDNCAGVGGDKCRVVTNDIYGGVDGEGVDGCGVSGLEGM